MDGSIVPPAPYLQTPLSVATRDGGLLYVGPRCVVYIGPYSDENKAPDIVQVDIRQVVKDLDVDPTWGEGSPHFFASRKGTESKRKFFAVVADDRTIQIYDLQVKQAVSGHKAHVNSNQQRDGNTQNKNNSVLISYMLNGDLLSVDAHDIVVYCVSSNSYHRSPLFISMRDEHITAMKCSPFKKHICAFGTNRGSVKICNMKKCTITFSHQQHLESVSTFVWRNLNTSMGKYAENKLKESPPHPSEKKRTLRKYDANEPFHMYKYDYNKTEFGAPLSDTRNKNEKVKDPFDYHSHRPIEFPSIDMSEMLAGFSISLKDLETGESYKEDQYNSDHSSETKKLNSQPSLSNEGSLAEKDSDLLLAPIEDPTSKLISDLSKTSEIISNLHLGDIRTGSSSPEKHYSKTEKLNSQPSFSNEGSLAINSKSLDDSIEVINSSSSDDANVMDGDHRKPKFEALHHIPHQAVVHDHGSSSGKSKATTEPIKSDDSIESCAELPDLLLDQNLDDDENDDNKIFLLSVSEDSAAWLINTQTNAFCNAVNKVGIGRPHVKFATVAWLDDLSIVVNEKSTLSVWKAKIEHKDVAPRYKEKHKSTITNIVTFSLVPGTKKLWCLSKDRKILLVDLEAEKKCLEIGTVSYCIKTIAECPDDMNKIALGLIDKRVGLFDISKLTPSVIPISNIQHTSISSAIISSAWSPDSTKLAIGSIDGKLGVINIDTDCMIDFRPKCIKEIYSIAWLNDYVFFVCNGSVYVHDCRKIKADAVLVAKDSGHATSINIRNDFLLVGVQDGQVMLFTRDKSREFLYYKRVLNLILIPRYITMMVWNPLRKNTLAVVGNDCQVSILHFHEAKKSLEFQQKLKSPQKNCLFTCVKWSNFNENLLLTSDRQGNIIIWDLSKTNPMILIREYPCPITSAIFLPSDENIVMFSGNILPLSFMDINKELERGPMGILTINTIWASRTGPEVHAMSSTARKRARKAQRRDEAIKSEDDKQTKDNSETNKGCTAKTDMEKEDDEIVNKLMERFANASPPLIKKPDFMTHPETLLYLSAKDMNKDTVDKLKIALSGDSAEIRESIFCSNLLFDTKFALDLMKTEMQNHRNLETRPLASIYLNLMDKNSFKEEIANCVLNRTLSEWHVALAPSYGMDYWKEVSEKFAAQLIERGHVLQGATYLLAHHNEIQAVRTLVEHSYYREALLLCQIVFKPNNSLTHQVINEWLIDLEKHGNVQAAALICVLIGRYKQGYQYLSKIREPTPQIVEVLQLIKEKGNLYSELGEKRPEKSTPQSKQGDEPPNSSLPIKTNPQSKQDELHYESSPEKPPMYWTL